MIRTKEDLLESQASLLLTPRINVDGWRKVELSRKVTTKKGFTHVVEERKAKVPHCDKPDPELLISTVIEFKDICQEVRLDITEGDVAKAKFRECLGNGVRDAWDVVVTKHPGKDMMDFDDAVEAWLLKLLPTDALKNQKKYLRGAVKKHEQTVEETATRIQNINKLMKWFPGDDEDKGYSAYGLKEVFLELMPSHWQGEFGVHPTLKITKPTCTFEQVVDQLKAIEHRENMERIMHYRNGGPLRKSRAGRHRNGRNQAGGRARYFGRGSQPSPYFPHPRPQQFYHPYQRPPGPTPSGYRPPPSGQPPINHGRGSSSGRHLQRPGRGPAPGRGHPPRPPNSYQHYGRGNGPRPPPPNQQFYIHTPPQPPSQGSHHDFGSGEPHHSEGMEASHFYHQQHQDQYYNDMSSGHYSEQQDNQEGYYPGYEQHNDLMWDHYDMYFQE